MGSIIRSAVSTLAFVSLAALMAAPVPAQDPYMQPDESWISIDGSVKDVSADRFTLDYGDGLITVEMDDGDRDADGYKLVTGDKVRVLGKIDDDFLEMTKIEASSVYVENLDTYFYASPKDEEDTFVAIDPVQASRTVLQGTVTDVGDDEFKLRTGSKQITVQVEEMPYDPLDEEGYQKIEVGDYVSVAGELDYGLFERRELTAHTVTTLFTS
jgi:uncharacterized protein YdeI (BOF family)